MAEDEDIQSRWGDSASVSKDIQSRWGDSAAVSEEPSVDPELIEASEAEEGTFADVAKGAASGLLNIPQGVTELAAEGVDLVFDTDTATSVTEAFESARDYAGIRPEGTAGEVAETLIQFGVPGLGAASAVSRMKKLADSPKYIRWMSELGAAGVTDAMVTTDGTGSIGDFFGGPTQTDRTDGLEGREESLRRISNRFKIGAEAATVVGALPGVTKVAGETIKVTSKGVAWGARGVQKTVEPVYKSAPVQKLAKRVGEQKDQWADTPFFQFLDDISGWLDEHMFSKFRSRGKLPSEVYEAEQISIGSLNSSMERVARNVEEINRAVTKGLGGPMKAWMSKLTNDQRNAMHNIIGSVMRGEDHTLMLGSGDKIFKIWDGKSGARRIDVEEFANAIREAVPGIKTTFDADKLAKRLAEPLENARSQIDDLSVQFKDIPEVSDAIKAAIEANTGSYMTRVYKAHVERNWKKTVLKRHPHLIDNAVEDMMKIAEDSGSPISHSDAVSKVDEILSGKFPYKAGDDPTEVLVRRLRGSEVVQQRKQIPDSIRLLMGEIRDPRSQYVHTMAKMVSYAEDQRFYKTLIREGKQGGYVWDDIADVPTDLRLQEKVVRFGEAADGTIDEKAITKYGPLAGKYIKREIAEYLTNTKSIYGTDNVFGRMYANYFLPLKGVSQFSKTVLSPITHVRNFTTASMFALAQGNVGRGSNLIDSFQVVKSAIKKMPKDKQLNYYRKLQGMNVTSSQVQVEEMHRLMAKEDLMTDPAIHHLEKIAGSGFMKNMPGVGLARDVYQGTDDLWKIYNFEFEKSKFLGAITKGDKSSKAAINKLYKQISKEIDDEIAITGRQIENMEPAELKLLEDKVLGNIKARGELGEIADADVSKLFDNVRQAEMHAAKIVRDTVPNYGRVPEFIRDLRKLPVGNFISFPAEIIRTGANTLGYAAKELMSDNAAIREIGARRLMGLSAATYGVGNIVQGIAGELTGVTSEMMREYQRLLGADWQAEGTLIPIGKTKRGNVEFFDYSYSNPYDFWVRPIRAVQNAMSEGEIKGQDTDEIIFRSGLGVIDTMIRPFLLEESIMTQKLREATFGERSQGGRVWGENDPIASKLSKSFIHVLDGVLPPLTGMDFNPRQADIGAHVQVGRFLSSVGHMLTDEQKQEYMDIAGLDWRGHKRFLATELLRGLSGITPTEMRLDKSLMWAGFEHGVWLDEARRTFTYPLTTGGAVTADQIVEAYRVSNEKRFRAFQDIYSKIEMARSFGMKDRDIAKQLSKGKVGDIGLLLKGKYKPYIPASSTIQLLQSYPENVPKKYRNKVPMDLIRGEIQSWIRRPLKKVHKEVDPRSKWGDSASPSSQRGGSVRPGSKWGDSASPISTAPADNAPTPVTSAPTPTPAPGTSLSQTQIAPRSPAELAALGLESPLEQAIAARQQRRVG